MQMVLMDEKMLCDAAVTPVRTTLTFIRSLQAIRKVKRITGLPCWFVEFLYLELELEAVEGKKRIAKFQEDRAAKMRKPQQLRLW